MAGVCEKGGPLYVLHDCCYCSPTAYCRSIDEPAVGVGAIRCLLGMDFDVVGVGLWVSRAQFGSEIENGRSTIGSNSNSGQVLVPYAIASCKDSFMND